jgi:ABC-2 type transport system permease protein
VTPAQQYTAFQTILLREIRRFIRIWIQTVVPPAIMMSLYFIIFGQLIGSQIGPIDGYSYIDYIVPGLILMAVITNAYANVVSSFFSSKFQHSIEELIITPTPNFIILGGYVAGGIARGLVVGTAVTLFSIAGFINAVYARSFDDISIIPTFVLTPLTYLGGIFYSVNMLPEFWQNVSLINPILYMINAFRYGLLGITDINLTLAFAIIIAFTAALFAFALSLLNRGVGIKS